MIDNSAAFINHESAIRNPKSAILMRGRGLARARAALLALATPRFRRAFGARRCFARAFVRAV
ncbi:MAG TPA: hypothetical protein VF064_10765, partial [Pyrinomonadaceae bacterium]